MLLSRIKGTILFNIVRAFINLITSIFIAKFLGVEDYGRFSFLIATLVAFRSLVDMSTSSAFFTFISRCNLSKTHFIFYYLWLLIQFFTSTIIIYLFIPNDIFDYIWVGESRFLVFVGFCAIFSQFSLYQASSQIGDAGRRNIKISILNLTLSAINLLLVILLNYSYSVSIEILFYIIILVWVLGSLVPLKMYDYCNDEAFNLKKVLSEYKAYCLPLIPYAWVGLIYEFGERWMLQSWGGGIDQGYYSVAIKVSAIPLFFTNSILRIFWKETTESYKNKDFIRMNKIYKLFTYYLVIISGFITFIILPWTPNLLDLIFGNDFIGGHVIFNIIVLSTLFSCVHQVCSSVFYATSKTQTYVTITLTTTTLGFLFTYILLSPNHDLFYFNLGGVGLAYKALFYQIITVSIFAYVLCKKLNYSNIIPFIILTSAYFFAACKICIFVTNTLLLSFIYSFIIYILIFILFFIIYNKITSKIFDFNFFNSYKYL